MILSPITRLYRYDKVPLFYTPTAIAYVLKVCVHIFAGNSEAANVHVSSANHLAQMVVKRILSFSKLAKIPLTSQRDTVCREFSGNELFFSRI